MLGDSGEVAALEATRVRWRAPHVGAGGIVGGIAVGKPVRKDLIDHGPLGPRRDIHRGQIGNGPSIQTLHGIGDSPRHQVDGLTGGVAKGQAGFVTGRQGGHGLPEREAPRAGDDSQWKTEILLGSPDDDEAIRETRLCPDADPVAAVGLAIEEGAVGGVEADVPGRDVPGQPVHAQVAVEAADAVSP
jgi:hypothetical protein